MEVQKHSRIISNQIGFTMVELVIVIVLVGVIAMTASLLIGQAAQTYQKEGNYSAMTSQDLLALEEMEREIRIIRSPSDITTCTSTNLTFTDVNGNLIVYSYSGTTLSAGGNPLASNLSGFSFAYFNNSGGVAASCALTWTVTINLTATQGSDSLPMRISLFPRNF